MGSLNMSALHLYAMLSELLGIKAGLAVSQGDLRRLLSSDEMSAEYAELDLDQDGVRIHSSSFEELIEILLYKVGRLKKRTNHIPGISQYHRYKNDPTMNAIWEDVLTIYTQWMPSAIRATENAGAKLIDPEAVMRQVAKKHGKRGLDLLMELFEEQNTHVYKSPWNFHPTTTEWKDTIELRALFEKESLNSMYGNFFDQRYIDFLNRNFEDIDSIHWRKFEQFTAEYFDRNGFLVELGPGRGDDGVDVRAWPKEYTSSMPPLIIVQCKRQKAAVEKVIVKSLYADVVQEKAASGLIVTTSRLSKGARDTSAVRKYPIDVADRQTLKVWLETLQSPTSGVIT